MFKFWNTTTLLFHLRPPFFIGLRYQRFETLYNYIMALTYLYRLSVNFSDRYPPSTNLSGFRFPSLSGTRCLVPFFSVLFPRLFARLIRTAIRIHNGPGQGKGKKQKRSMVPLEWSCHRRFSFQSINRKQRDATRRWW